MVINPSGTLVYAIRSTTPTWGPSPSVSVIDTATNAVVYEGFGSDTTDLEWTPDGTRHYSAQGDYHYIAWSNVDYTSGYINIALQGTGRTPATWRSVPTVGAPMSSCMPFRGIPDRPCRSR